MSTAEQKARADRLHNRIQQIISSKPDTPVPPRTPREFIDRKMTEIEWEEADHQPGLADCPPLKRAAER